MKINVASFGGRSHLLDTARELEKFGHNVRFYSYLTNQRATKFGLKRNCNYSLFIPAIPFLIAFLVCDSLKLTSARRYIYYLYKRLFDYITAWIMKPCDIFIEQSAMHVYSLKWAKKRYNAITILERGTSHVIEQTKALNTNPALKVETAMPNPYFAYDLKGYDFADYISVGSEHVMQSFLKHGFRKEQIFVNNYGFDASQFKPTQLTKNPYDILIVGQWSHRKGADLLVEVCKKTQLTLLHVGSIVDVDFPQMANMKHHAPVPQAKLIDFYAQARIFVLPSREEGLALVQAQAVACGLPLVCSTKTGGRDLRKYIDDDRWIIETPDWKVDSLIKCINNALLLSKQQTGVRSYVTSKFDDIEWSGYGKRYNKFLNEIIHKKK